MGVIDTTANIALCNQSLGLLGAEAIELGGTDQNHTYCETFFEQSRDEILAGHKWNFAKKRALAIQTTDPLFGYDNAFTKPSDCLKVWRIAEDNAAIFEVEGNLILTDEGEDPDDWVTATAYIVGDVVSNSNITYTCKLAHTSGTFATDLATKWTSNVGDYLYLPIEYVYQATDVTSFPPYLYQCLVYNLAIKLCSPIKQEAKTALGLQTALYGGPRNYGYLGMARSFDAQEGGGEVIKTQTWLDTRL